MIRLLAAVTFAALTISTAPSPRSAADILRELETLPRAWVERETESEEELSSRRYELAGVLATYSLGMQRKLTAKAWGETRLARYTRHDCTGQVPKGAGHCDHGAARSYWQLHRGACPQLWECSESEAVKVAAECAAARLRQMFARCKGDPAKSFAAYGWGKCVATVNSKRKAELYRRLRGQR